MGKDEDAVQLRQRSEADGRAHVVGEEQERRAVRQEEAVVGEPVHDRAHPMLANAEMDVAAGVILGLHVAAVLHVGERGGVEIGGTAHQAGQELRRLLDDGLPVLARGFRRGRVRDRRRQLLGQIFRDLLVGQRAPQLRLLRTCALPLAEPALPVLVALLQLLDPSGPESPDLVGDQEGGVERPAQVLLRGFRLVFSERRAVHLVGVGLMWRPEPDHRPHADQGRSRIGLGCPDGAIDRLHVVAVVDALDVPRTACPGPR